MKKLFYVGVLGFFLVVFFYVTCSANIIIFPSDGLLGDSNYPRDSGEVAKGERRNYTTVWTGKYTGNYQSRYKGTGGHPGMNITGAVGEKAYTIIDNGKVVVSRDNDIYNSSNELLSKGWGGLVVIEYKACQFNESSAYNYYVVYAHLRERKVTKGDIVKLGSVIGIMGGGINDPHHGASDGRHLHFQIEKRESWNDTNNDNNPYWPLNNDGNIPDPTNIGLNTVDPIKFIESNYAYFVGKSQSYGWKFQDTTGSQF